LHASSAEKIKLFSAMEVFDEEHSELVTVRKPQGTLIRHFTAQSYGASLNESRPSVGSHFSEWEHMKNGVRHVRVSGRELLGSVGPRNNGGLVEAYSPGDRLMILPVTPAALGGRLSRMATEFLQHKALRIRVHFETSLPATAEGALAMYFVNDVGLPTLERGMDELAHASTFPDFRQFPVWQEGSMDIDTSEDGVLNRYFDESSGDMRFESQGYLVLLAASFLSFQQDGVGGLRSAGNLYVEYDFDFFEAALDASVSIRSTTLLTVTTNVVVGSPGYGYNCIYRVNGAPAANYPSMVIGSYPPGVSAPEDLIGWLFVGTVCSTTTAGGFVDWFDTQLVRQTDDPTTHTLSPGVGFIMKFYYDDASSAMWGALYADLSSATEDTANYGQSTGVLQYVPSAPPAGLANLQAFGQWIKLY
jgi:hypothetical protein